jgi:hypothetical protein
MAFGILFSIEIVILNSPVLNLPCRQAGLIQEQEPHPNNLMCCRVPLKADKLVRYDAQRIKLIIA